MHWRSAGETTPDRRRREIVATKVLVRPTFARCASPSFAPVARLDLGPFVSQQLPGLDDESYLLPGCVGQRRLV